METPHEPSTHASPRVVVSQGPCWRLAGPPDAARVRPALARELRRVLDRFAIEARATPQRPVSVEFRPGVVGHHRQGRAADLYGVGGVGLQVWKQRWDAAKREAASTGDLDSARWRLARERQANLGWRLYRALQHHGRWAQPYGYPIQLFGPWTREEGPWRPISDTLLHAHRDHIHVAL